GSGKGRLLRCLLLALCLSLGLSGVASARVAGTVKIKPSTDPGGGSGEELLTVTLPVDDEALVQYEFSTVGGAVSQAVMLYPRFTRKEIPELEGLPESKRAPGPIDLVTTWSPVYYPFQTIFRFLESTEAVKMSVRRATGGMLSDGVINNPSDQSALEVDRPVRAGDAVVVHEPAEVAGRYQVKRVTPTGITLSADEKIQGKQATGLRYEVIREGSAQELWLSDHNFVRIGEQPGLPVTYVWPDPRVDDAGVFVERHYRQGANPYELILTVTIHNLTEGRVRHQMGVQVTGWQHPGLTEGSMFMTPPDLYASSCFTGDGLEREEYTDLHEESARFDLPTQWAGVDTRYFLMAVATDDSEGHTCALAAEPPPRSVLGATLMARSVSKIEPETTACVPDWLGHREGMSTCRAALDVLGAGPEIGPDDPRIPKLYKAKLVLTSDTNETARLKKAYGALIGRPRASARYSLYIGPKDPRIMKEQGRRLDASLDFGILSILAKGMLAIMGWFHGLTGMWWLAIVLLTLVFKLALLPLTNKSFRSMARMSDVRPKLDKLKEEHGDDKEAFARAQMALFKREGINPLGGCFPMMVQMPIWFALYQSIYSSVDLYNAPLGLWITDLSGPDPYYIFPVILGFLMLGQSYFTPTAAGMDKTQAQIMKYGMPVMFSVMMVGLPSGLVLYICVSTLLTIGQNVYLRRGPSKAGAVEDHSPSP
ncbi:MAG: YidC/Oxa1 family insertase periplasmic-domain containing protein, partial [Myxococcota bacterium]|nr:YidC/Oxa1 family insertase periplasmic-domain containing protein [Myxococcota bacterium]